MTRRSAFAHQLLETMKNRRTPLPIELEQHGVIVAKRYRYDGPFSVDMCFLHSEGDIVIGSNWQYRAEMMGVTSAQLLKSSYADLAEIVCDIHGCG